jgi:DNA repair exonuclease SbcCD ATPase subunit
VRNTSVVSYASATASDAVFSDLQKRIHELEDEKRELGAVIDDLRSHLASQPLHKEKDLLGLRETINRKEKDVLDLRDALDAKDRQILDQKDRMREHERARRDLEEKMLAFEKNLMHASEKVMALAQDKEKSIERERGLKVRLEDAHAEIGKTHDELDLIKKRLATVEDRARLELDRVRNDLEARIAEDEENHKNEVARLREDRDTEKSSRDSELQAATGKINSKSWASGTPRRRPRSRTRTKSSWRGSAARTRKPASPCARSTRRRSRTRSTRIRPPWRPRIATARTRAPSCAAITKRP